MKSDVKIKKNVSRPQSGTKADNNIPTASQKIRTNEISRGNAPAGEPHPGELARIRPGRIAAYARVSTQKQESNETINSQIAIIKTFLEDNGHKIADEHIYIDEGFSGSVMARPGLDKLRDGVAMQRYDKVLVYDPDRLARKYVYQMLIVEEFERHECSLYFIRCPIGKTPDEALLLQMQGVIAEYERAKIAERTRRGRLHKMREGELITGQRTFGYQYIKKSRDIPAHFKVIKEEADIIKKIFEWYTSENICIRKIATRLNESSVPTARGNEWRHSTLHKMLKNSIYIGIRYSNKSESVHPKRKNTVVSTYRRYEKCSYRTRPRSEWISSPSPRIITDESFELAQERLEQNKILASRKTKGEYLLRGLIFCPNCGHRMQIGGRMKYSCHLSRKCRAEDCGHTEVCTNNAKFPVKELDDIVWKEVVKLIRKPSNLKTYFKKYSGKFVPKATQGLEKLREKISNTNEQIKRLNTLFIQGIIVKAEHGARHSVLSDKIHMLQSQFNKNKQEHFDESEIQEMLLSFSKFSKFSKSIKEQFKNIDFTTKRFIIEQLVKRVILSKNEITIELSAPLTKSVLCTQNQANVTSQSS